MQTQSHESSKNCRSWKKGLGFSRLTNYATARGGGGFNHDDIAQNKWRFQKVALLQLEERAEFRLFAREVFVNQGL